MPGFSQRAFRQQAGYEEWIRRILIALVLVFLVVSVAFPVFGLIRRSTSAEVPVVIWGPQEIRVGDYNVELDGGQLVVNEEARGPDEGRYEEKGLIVEAAEGVLERVVCTQVEAAGAVRNIAPVRIVREGEDYTVDGREPATAQALVMRSIGFALFQRYFSNPALYQSFYNSLFVSVVSTLIATTLAFAYAFCLTRTAMPFKMAFRVLAMVPIFAPTMVYGLSLIYLFGNQGLITTGFSGALPWLGWDIGLYGPVGIIIAEVVFTFPPALVILLVAFANTDARLYEAAASLGASSLRTFFTVTLPGVRYGLINAAFVCFTLAFTDFGAPTIVGGNYNVLAVDIYKQVVGQMNYGMAATVSIVLLIPAVAAFIVQRIVQRRVVAQLSARSVPYVPTPNRRNDALALAVCGLIALGILGSVFTAGFAALFVRWPYDLSLTFKHFLFEGANGSYSDFWNSVRMACYTAIIGTFLTFGSAYLVEKSKGLRLLRQSAYVMSIIPLALPGMVVGIAYIFFFNAPAFAVPLTGWSLPNPLSGLYGTMAILVLCNVVHFYTVSYLTATTALRQLDSEFESVSESLAVPFYKTFFRVTAPVSLPAIFEIAAFFFVNGMATVSGVIFLYTADTRLASVAVVDMANEGNNAAAAAMCMLIVLTNLAVRGLIELANWGFAKRTAKWRQR